MAFWGIEVKPGKPFTHTFDPARGRLRISQATLGIGSATKTSLVQCNVGNKSPVLLCALLPDKAESCHLDLEFEEAEEVVFSVIGPRSVHLTGFYLANGSGRNSNVLDESESYGEDIANTDDESAQCDDEEYDDSFIDDDELEVHSASPVSSYGGSDEEIVYKKKPKVKRGTHKLLKKNYQTIESDDEISSQEKVVVNDCTAVSGLESEDDDDFPIFSARKSKSGRGEKSEKNVSTVVDKKTKDDSAQGTTDNGNTESRSNDQAVKTSGEPERKSKKKRKNRTEDNITVEAGALNPSSVMEDDKCVKNKAEDQLLAGDKEIGLSPEAGCESGSKRKKRKKELIAEKTFVEGSTNNGNVLKEGKVKKNEGMTDDAGQNVKITREDLTFSNDNNIDSNQVPDKSQSAEKKTRKKKKSKIQENENVDVGLPLSNTGLKHKVESSKSKSLSNGLIIEELEEGKLDGKIAAPGKKVKVYYTGWLKEKEQVFDSNVGDTPLKFRLGGKDVIEAWNIGVDGMRVGGKRKLVVPPSMGFGNQGAGENIPPNSWLEYEIELVSVR